MSLALHELLLCCRQLENDKATERRKEIDKLKRLLQDQETVQQLDRNSDARHGRQANWDMVFRFLQKYIYKETESLKSAKTNVSQSTQAARQKKMQEISSLVKYFIRCANKRAPRLKCTELLLHVTNTVKDSTMCAAYGADYSSILLKDILTVRKYWCEITEQQWAELLNIYFNLYLKPNSAINRLLVARIIQTLTRGCCQQTEGMHSKFFNFFSVVMQRTNDDSNSSLIGAYAFDTDKWQRNLYNLYDTLMSEISQIGSRGKYSSGSRSIAVKENLVELMADICYQLFTEDTRILEITQASFAVTQRDPLGSGAPSKRRRIELGWEVVRDKLQRSNNYFDVIPWLQIAACLIARHPMSLPSSELIPLLAVLHQLLAEQKRGEKATFVLRCLKEVAVCQKQKTDVILTPKSDLQKLWTKIWAVTLRSLTSPQTEADSFALLAVILDGRLVAADRDFWKIFSGSAGKPSSSAVQCLCLALTSCIVPDQLTSNLELPLHEGNGGKRLLKEEIIKWLLFGHQDDEMEDGNEHAPLINQSCCKVLIPPLAIRSAFDEIKTIAQCIEEDWKVLLANCFPRILVNILPYFASECSSDTEKTNREVASKVYDLLRDDSCLGTQQIDNLFLRNLPDIVVELLMTLHESPRDGEPNTEDILQYTRELDPAPNPPYFPSSVIKATLDYISSCHKSKQKNLIAILSKTPDAFQKILLSICKQAAESNNSHKKHRILIIYHLFVNLLLAEIKDGLGGAWAFVLRDVIYTLIHHINNRVFCPTNDVCTRSTMLCLDLLHRVCRAAVTYCKDALGSHLRVIVGSLIPLANSHAEIQEQVCDLLTFLVIESQDNENLYHTIKLLDPFPDHPLFKELRQTHQKIKYSKGAFSLIEEIRHFLSASVCDSLPLTRLEGLNDLRKQLQQHKEEMKDIVRDFQGNPQNNVIPKLIMSLLELSKNAVDLNNGKEVLEAVGSCLGELGPIDFFTIALQHRKELLYGRAGEYFEDEELQCVLVILTLINSALTDHCIHVRSAAATCLKNILATKTGCQFWESYKDTGDPMLVYLQPFRSPKKKVLEVEDLQRTHGDFDSIDDNSLWTPQNSNHENWIKSLTCALLKSGGVRSEALLLLKPLCEVKADFCQAMLPYIIHNILLCDPNNTWRTLLSKHIQGFFTSCCRFTPTSSRSATPASSDSESEGLARGTVNIASRRTMLSILEYLRKQKRPGQRTAFEDNFWLDLDYLEVAMAVQSCAAHFTALLYTEIYADKIKLDGEQKAKSKSTARKTLKFEEESQTMTIVSISERSKEETGISLQDLMMDIYRSIGEPDSLYGCGGGKMLNPLARIRTYEHEAKWGKALVTYDLETNLTPATRQAGIMQALQNFGLCHTLSTYLRGLERENPEWSSELQEIHFQAAWRNMQWDQSPSYKNDAEGPGYHESLYSAIQSLRDKEFPTFHDHIKFARVKEVEELCKGSLESVYSLYPTLCRLQVIGELSNAGQMFSRLITEHQLNDLYVKWQQQSQLLKDSDFGFQEPVLALRSVILETMLEKNVSNQDCLNQILTKHLVELSRVSRFANNTQLPEKAMFQIKQHNSAQFLVSEWQLEEAQVFWAKKEQSLALGLLQKMVHKLENNSFEVENEPKLQLIYVECLRLCGNWLAETCLESPTIIMQNYLEKAVEVAESYSTGSCDRLHEGRMKAFLSLARFSDAQYQRIDNYMKSSEFENKQALLAKAKQEVELMKHHKVQTNRYTIKVQRELELDECAISALKEDRKHFLCTAIRNYINCLVSGEEHDMWIFRLCSLWLENSGLPEVNSIMKKDSQKIPSFKFLPLMYQLAARMGTKNMGRQDFHEVLNNVIGQTSLDHPYHTLFIILALANANKDDLLLKSEIAKRGRLSKNAPKKISQTDEDRMEAACNIVNTIRKHKPHMVRDVEKLCDAYIVLANMDANHWKTHRNGIPIPSDQPITKLKNLQDVVIPTMELKVDPSGKYENLVTITSFKPEFRLAGGLNLPKIIDCVGSDGKERRQLVKGRDDLRQDAVMQQVFQMCNTLLQRNSETRKRKLSIRRYKVVPLSQRSGVLEWCSGTVPIGEYLVNTEDGAHKRYRPGDCSSLQCQRRMMDVQKARFEDKYQAFLDVSEHFRPVFRYFCMEKFLDPAIWFEKRLSYTRSVATSSIVGYIVGLGDRHVQNILIDEETAELVHIDLGVAFEQGKILPTPETVPFRLTRDIVDGMGITGVEGVFRRCCEKTMEVMRRSQDALLTIVEVLLYDPLFDWTMNPLKALYLQQDDAELNATLPEDPECNRNSCNDTQSFNKVAERVLLRLQEKLKGVEEGTVLNAEGQVNLLIQQAMDPKNLSRLFPGWKAWV
ncbi:hypothetical protein GDO78_000508 [Eleutherodactylus coqui]|uniref:non-specific serine/threonine protein kinase n=1 Tax=Eleutherodactylus coqui TaxID=57060 RepID=A0A8J6FPF1_ELECQ|nr:hypothetical protein GDO78_000508 [Eleutherodactylus coqui]